MTYNCNENEMIDVDENRFKFIVMILHTMTPNNGGSHYFLMLTLFTIQTSTIKNL